jgi:hypothetical protein
MRSVSTIAAYRERWGVGADGRPLGPEVIVTTIEHVGHRKRAQAAVDRALAISRQARHGADPQVSVVSPDTALQRESGVDL